MLCKNMCAPGPLLLVTSMSLKPPEEYTPGPQLPAPRVSEAPQWGPYGSIQPTKRRKRQDQQRPPGRSTKTKRKKQEKNRWDSCRQCALFVFCVRCEQWSGKDGGG